MPSSYYIEKISAPAISSSKISTTDSRRGLEDQLAEVKDKDFSIPKRLQEFLELAKTAYLLYEQAPFERKRRLLEKITSNRTADYKNVEIILAFPFSDIATRFENQHGGPSRSTVRTWDKLFTKIINFLQASTEINGFQ